VLRLKLVRSRVLSEPQSSLALAGSRHNLLLLGLQHDDLLFTVLGGGTVSHGGPRLSMERLALQDLRRRDTLGSWLANQLLQTRRDARLPLISLVSGVMASQLRLLLRRAA